MCVIDQNWHEGLGLAILANPKPSQPHEPKGNDLKRQVSILGTALKDRLMTESAEAFFLLATEQ